MPPTRSQFEVEIEGRQYTCSLDMDAMIRLEEHFSTPTKAVTFQDITELVQRGSIRHARAFFWSLLQRHHPDVSLSQAGDLMLNAIGGLDAAMKKAIETAVADPADLAALGVKTDRPPKARTKRADGTGGNSGSRPGASV